MQSSHTDFGQAGYSQQYAFPSALQTVAANSAHDMSKQISAGQPGIYPNSGGIPSAPQPGMHHQHGMAGPAPSPQPTPLVQQGQQMNRGQIALHNYYSRNAPRMPNMGRNPIPNVVNQTPQQTSQYSHLQMVPSHTLPHGVAPIIMNTSIATPMFSQRPNFQTTQFSHPFLNASNSALYYNWNYNNAQPSSVNGFYPSHQMSSYNAMPSQISQPPATQNPKATKRLAIIDPDTGKNILEGGINIDTLPQQETDNSENDPNICIQFATQVAQAIANARDDKSEPSAKSLSIEGSRISQPVGLCQRDIDTVETEDQPENNSVVEICEQYIDNQNIQNTNESLAFYEKNDLNNIDDNCENNKCVIDSVEPPPTIDIDSTVYELNKQEKPCEIKEETKPDNLLYNENVASENLTEYAIPESVQPNLQLQTAILSNKTPSDTVILTSQPSPEDKSTNSDICEQIATSKIQEKPESIKKKTKKKKDLNKKGESKEGGEMDAFLDKGEEVQTVTTTSSPSTSSVPTPLTPPAVEQQPPSPIVDSEILNSIPLPEENPLTNEIPQSETPNEPSPTSPNSEDKENVATEETNKIVLKYSYKEDQWSPLNPEGKKQYDRDFLLQLQSQPMSLCKPSNLPNLDVIKDKAHIQRLTEVNRAVPMPMPPRYNDPFMPQFARGGTPRPPHPAINRRSQQGRGDKKLQKPPLLSSSMNIKLHESENAWKPTPKKDLTADENSETQELYRKVRSILNKLTPQKFETLVEQVKNLDIDTEEKLNGVIDLVFEKAIDEPNFSVPYANMCKQLALTIKVPLTENPSQMVNFRKLLLTKCQKEFERDRCEELKREERMKAIESAEPDKRKELQMEFDEEEKKMRYRQLGNIRFIGELFKLNMLIEPIMHECIKKLLIQGDEESLECLCRLLKTIGKELEEKSSKSQRDGPNPMDQYFNQMQRIVDRRLTSSRVRFMLQDVIDLKKNNWVPRRDENNPKTIDQIHKEAEMEAREQQAVYQNMSSYPKRMPDDRRKNTGRNMGVSEDGWTASKSSKGSYSVVDPSKLKLTKTDEVDSIRLGPGGRGLQSWGRGSSGGAKTSVDSDLNKTALTNRYSALADQSLTPSFENRRGSQRSAASSRESSRGRNTQLPPAIRKTPSTSRERENLIETVKEFNRTNVTETKVQESKKNESQVNGKTVDSTNLALKGPELSEDEIDKKTKPLIDEFLHNADFEEAIKCVTELASPSTVSFFIYSAINQVLERSSQARNLLGQLFFLLHKKEIIEFDHLKKGLSGVLENMDDYALDIPLIWDYMGELLEAMIDDNKLSLDCLLSFLEPCIPSESAGKLVSAVLHCAAKKKGTIKLGEMWRASSLKWETILGPTVNLTEFINTHKLEFTVSSPPKVLPDTDIAINEIKAKLKHLLATEERNEEIFDWIDANVPPSAVTEPSFIRALSAAVHENAITDVGIKCELDAATLKKRIPLLTRYIDHNVDLELQALYAIQHLMIELDQPKGILRSIFDILYDDDVITEETFKNWERSNDPNEEEGKGVAVMSVRGFFTWLREAESGDDADVEDE